MRDKREKFVELAEKRVNRLLNDIRLIGNLSNKANYEYSQEDIRKIFGAIEGEMRATKRRFEGSTAGAEPTFKL